MDDLIQGIVANLYIKIVEEQERILMQTIQEIGGDIHRTITIDKNKVVEALNDYVQKEKGVEYAEVKHGEWKAYGLMNPQCSLCHKHNIEKSRFCPNCGARMDGGAER